MLSLVCFHLGQMQWCWLSTLLPRTWTFRRRRRRDSTKPRVISKPRGLCYALVDGRRHHQRVVTFRFNYMTFISIVERKSLLSPVWNSATPPLPFCGFRNSPFNGCATVSAAQQLEHRQKETFRVFRCVLSNTHGWILFISCNTLCLGQRVTWYFFLLGSSYRNIAEIDDNIVTKLLHRRNANFRNRVAHNPDNLERWCLG